MATAIEFNNVSKQYRLGQIGGSQSHLGAIDYERDRELHGIALLGVETVDKDDVTDLDLFLMATGLHNRVHNRSFVFSWESFLAWRLGQH